MGLIPSVKDSNYSDPLSICGASSDVRTPSSLSLVSPLSPFYFVLSCLLSLCWRSHRMLFCVHVCIQLCTHVYTVVYTRVHRGVHYYFVSGLSFSLWMGFSLRRGGLSFTLWMGSCFLYGWALLGSPGGLVPARRMDTSQLYEWARTSTMDSLLLFAVAGSSHHRYGSPINNVPACEGGGNLRCDLELWWEMHYLCRRKSKRGCAQQTRRTREER